MTTLREAAEMALKALIEYEEHEEQEYGFHRKMAEIDALGGTPPAIVALRAALAEPVQEPVAWLWPHQLAELQEWKNEGNIRAWSGRGPKPDGVVPVYTAP